MFGLFKKEAKNSSGPSRNNAAGFTDSIVPKVMEIKIFGKTFSIKVDALTSNKDKPDVDAAKVQFINGNIQVMMPQIESEITRFLGENLTEFLDEFYEGETDFVPDTVEIRQDGQPMQNYDEIRKASVIAEIENRMEPTGLYFISSEAAELLITTDSEVNPGGLKVTVNVEKEIKVEIDIA
jgi:hypothetical protein